MHGCRPVPLLLLFQTVLGCAYISDDHAAWRKDPDGDGVAWTEDCDESDDDAGAPQVWFADADADGFGDSDASKEACSQPEGFVSVGGDCNDLDPRVRPGAKDKCNEIDDDCDTEIDEDAEAWTFYVDGDGDGFGDAAQVVEACTQPDGTVEDDTDCDDESADRFPGNPEVCDELDNDCDGSVDEEVEDPPIWYVDTDGDGFGDPANTSETCTVPVGFVANGDDCDDTTTAWQDRGPEEIYYDGLENNCDEKDGDGDADDDGFWHEDYVQMLEAAGLTPLPIPEGQSGGDCDDTRPDINPGAIELPDSTEDTDCDGTITITADADGDGYDSVAAGGDDCDDTDPDVHPDAIEVCETVDVDDDCNGLINEEDTPDCTVFFRDEDLDGFGVSEDGRCFCLPEPPYTGEFGNDCDDGEPEVSPAGEEECYDGVDSDCNGEDNHPDCGAADLSVALFTGSEADELAGSSLGALTTGQLVVGAPGFDFGGESAANAGAVYVIAPTDPGPLLPGEAGLMVTGSVSDDRLGTAVLGLSDGRVAMSAPGSGEAGEVYLLDPEEVIGLEEARDRSSTTVQGYIESEFGAALAAGNLEEDTGRHLLIIGAPSSTFSQIWVVDPSIGGEIGIDGETESSGFIGGISSTVWQELGSALAVADVLGTGVDDLIIGVPDYLDDSSIIGPQGAVAVIDNISFGFIDFEGAADVIVYGNTGLDRLGTSVKSVGDVDGDGKDDLVVGAEQAGVSLLEDDPGAVYLMTDLSTGETIRELEPRTTLWGFSAGDRTGEQVVATDLNGDGEMDLVIGAGGAVGEAGAVYFFLGPISEGGIELSDDADFVLTGEDADDHFGQAIELAGDIDGDGLQDILIGAPDTSEGRGHIFLLSAGELPL